MIPTLYLNATLPPSPDPIGLRAGSTTYPQGVGARRNRGVGPLGRMNDCRPMGFNHETYINPADFLPAIFFQTRKGNSLGIGNPGQRGPTSGFLQINYSIVIFARVPFCRNVPAQ